MNVGNTRTQIGQISEGKLATAVRIPNTDLAKIVQHVVAETKRLPEVPAIVLAAVHEQMGETMTSALQDQLATDVYQVGRDVPVPIGQSLDRETLTGIDRMLNAAAAFDQLQQACVIVDAGTAVTVDFVDGEGTFHGGAIAPGAHMQLEALSQHASALPEIKWRKPDDEPFGRNTAEAMLQGVYYGIRGLVRVVVERYAEHYRAYPLVVATGGDSQLLFDQDDFVDRVIPDLTLEGIAVAVRHALATDQHEQEES
ncbi:MAG: type III pantothenate kinase [Phycisphaerales bacterium]|nr:type III pantothenate kinase [Phycisphaerales bacterium]